VSAIDARYRQRLVSVGKWGKWAAIGALVAGGAIAVGRLFGPSVADEIGSRAGEGFARGVAEAQDQIAMVRRKLSISGWGTYRQHATRERYR
jgi:hypothetical protein